MELTEKDKTFITYYQNQYRIYIFFFVFIFLFASFQLYMLFGKFIPIYTAAFQKTPKLSTFVQFGLIKMAVFNLIWIALLIGALIGSFSSYKKTKSIINKLMKS
ncbi:MAG: hypothetical protein JSV30_04570 [Candidatus Omnitrophota bacterium]|nr:MAG: hypothetical protein JSV30_04570 [Candidatus Omnitrophota bacterium]